MNADGSEQTQLTKAPRSGFWPTWSPDGSQITFTNYSTSGALTTHVMNADGSDVHQLTGGTTDFYPTWAPNGTILFLRVRQGGRPGDVFWCSLTAANSSS